MTFFQLTTVLIAFPMAMAFGWYLGRRTEWTPWIARRPKDDWELIDALIEAGNYPEAANRALQLLRDAERTHGLDDPQAARACMKLAEIEMATGNHHPAKQHLDRAHDIRERRFGAEEYPTVMTKLALGEWHARQGNPNQAEHIFNTVREILERRLPLGRNDPGLAATHNHLASLQLGVGRHDEAEANAKRALALAQHKQGNPADRVTGLTHLAKVQEQQNKLGDAHTNYQHALEESSTVYGERSPVVATCHRDLASILERCREYSKAAEHAKQALEIINSRLGPKHPDYAEALALLGQLHCECGRFDEGIGSMDKAVEIIKHAIGPEHPRVLNLKARRKRLTDRKHALPRGKGVKETSEAVVHLLRLAPAMIGGLLAEFPAELLTRRLAADLPTAAEYVHRLVQLQHRAEKRLEKMLSNPGTAIDEAQAPAEGPADDMVVTRDWKSYMRDYRERRKSLVMRLEALNTEQWLTLGMQHGRTRVTVLILFRQLALQEFELALRIEECLLTS